MIFPRRRQNQYKQAAHKLSHTINGPYATVSIETPTKKAQTNPSVEWVVNDRDTQSSVIFFSTLVVLTSAFQAIASNIPSHETSSHQPRVAQLSTGNAALQSPINCIADYCIVAAQSPLYSL